MIHEDAKIRSDQISLIVALDLGFLDAFHFHAPNSCDLCGSNTCHRCEELLIWHNSEWTTESHTVKLSRDFCVPTLFPLTIILFQTDLFIFTR